MNKTKKPNEKFTEITKFLKENLTIDIQQKEADYCSNEEVVTIQLKLNGKIISEDFCFLTRGDR